MKINYKVEGLKGALNKIKLFSEKKQNQIKDDIAGAGLLIETEAKKRAPINKQNGVGGILRSSIIRQSQPWKVRVGSDVSYAPHVEFGTVPHIITVKNAKVLSDGKRIFGRKVNHPGTKAQPFLRPAFDIGTKDLDKRIKKTLSTIK